MLILGLTGSIGMGKSATASLFAECGIPIYEADRAVHELYEGEAVAAVEAAFPGVAQNGRIDRERLGRIVIGDAAAIARLEAIVHPMVRERQRRFLAHAAQACARMALLDIPLLLETGGERRVNLVIVATAPADVQRRRVLERPGMTAAKLDEILAKQMPDAEKRRRAHFLVDTARGFDSARAQVRGIVRAVAVIPGRRT